MPEEKEVPLEQRKRIPASRSHLDRGVMVFVRGKRAEVVQEDYPIIFWRYEGEDCIKHQSFLVKPDIFEVLEGTPLREEQDTDVSSVMEYSDSGEEEFTIEEVQFEAEFPDFEEDGMNPFEQDDAPQASSPGGVNANMLAAFARKSAKFILEKEEGAEEERKSVEIDVRVPQGVHIESCLYLDVVIANKVSNIALIDSDRMKLDFKGVISSLELLRSDDCFVVCKESCSTIQIESCSNVVILMPFSIDECKIFATNCSNVKVIAEADPQFTSERGNEDDFNDDSSHLIFDSTDAIDRLDVDSLGTTIQCRWKSTGRKARLSVLDRDRGSFPTNL